ncbi:MAG: riboflavin synthase [Syntrophomonadaceae bacterium]|nr:riboflavin synthase [Syntrophomonadaceae bacterium]
MFTGIVESMGRVRGIKRGAQSFQIDIQAEAILDDVKLGDSIAVNGVCLTVNSYDSQHFTADVMPETMDKTTLKHLKSGEYVNLERALRVGDRLGGHIVQGHVDAVGIIGAKEKRDIAYVYTIKAPAPVLRYTVPKGSITVDGVSLTVIDVLPDSFTVSLIPHSADQTILGRKQAGDYVNLESDILGRYIEKLLQTGGDKETSSLSVSFLAENGFL